ncbi:MAG: hypothetical protein V4696_01440 [Pseudomonadota bacterium]
MGRTQTVTLTGFKELERALKELPKATGKNVLRRIGKGALEPMRQDAQNNAPVADAPYYIGKKGEMRLVQPGRIKNSIVVSEKRTRRAKGPSKNKLVNGKWRASASTGISIAMGPSSGGGLYNAARKEFGNSKTSAEPFMRPAWAKGSVPALEYIKDNLGDEIAKAARKVAKKRAKAGL